jgi:hypothetical protein
MTNTNNVVAGLAVAVIAWTILSQPKCGALCQSIFQPLATDGGRLIASGIIGLLIANS